MAELDIFSRILLILTIVFVLWHFIRNYSKNVFKKEEEIDFDEMIRKKKMEFLSNAPLKDETVILNDELSSLDPNSVEFLSLKKILDLKRDMEWGEGVTFLEIKENFKKITGINPDSLLLQQSINQIVKIGIKDFFKLEELVHKYLFMLTLIDATNKKYTPFASLSATNEININNWKLIAEYFFLQDKATLNEIILQKDLFKMIDDKEMEDYFKKFQRKDLEELSKELIQSAILIQAVTPIKEDDPYLVLGVSRNDDIEAIKKKYKQLALKLHPDRFNSFNLNDRLRKIISDNFLKVQNAFDKLDY